MKKYSTLPRVQPRMQSSDITCTIEFLGWGIITLLHLFIVFMVIIKIEIWFSGQSVRQGSSKPGFNAKSRHTKDFKNDTSLPNTQQCKVRIKGIAEQSWERISAFPYTLV